MKNLLFVFLAFVLLAMTSCLRRDGRVEVINQTTCTYNIFEGPNSNSGFLGAVGPGEIKTFKINSDDFFDFFEGTFAAEPVNCPNRSLETYDLNIMKGETISMLID